MAGMLVMPGTARFCPVACENDCCSDRDQSENANPQSTRGSQRCAKHKLPRPNFCLDHRFVRPNYAQPPGMFPCSNAQSSGRVFRSRAPQVCILANRLYANVFCCSSYPNEPRRIRLGGVSFHNVNEPLRREPVFTPDILLVHRTNRP